MKFKYETTKAFLAAVQAGEFTGQVIVDNDCVDAYQGDEKVCNFGDDVPENVLISMLEALGVEAERP